MKKLITAIILITITTALSSGMAAYANDDTEVLSATLTVQESNVIKPADKSMLGFNNDASWYRDAAYAYGTSSAVRPEFKSMLDEYGFEVPMLRAFIHHRDLDWKTLIGPESGRTGSGYSHTYTYGLAEWIKFMQQASPDIDFTFAINIHDDAHDLADLVRFLTLMPDDPNAVGSDGVNWAAKRMEYGIINPVPLCCLELGNEYDNECYVGGNASSDGIIDYEKMQYYIDRCNDIIPALRAVNPNVKLAVSACSQPKIGGVNEDVSKVNWKQWNGTVIPELGPKADYIVLHYYTSTTNNFGYFWDYENIDVHINTYVNQLPQEHRPQVFVSEYAIWRDLDDINDVSLRDKWTDLKAALAMGELVNRFFNMTEVGIASHHAFMSSSSTAAAYGGTGWGVIRPFDGGDYVLTALGEYYQLATRAAGGNVVYSALSGNTYAHWSTKYEDRTNQMITSTAFLEEDGYLNILLVNRNETYAQQIEFDAEGSYILESESVITNPDVNAANNPDNENLVYSETKLHTGSDLFEQYTVPPQSVVVLRLRPSDITSAVLSNIELSTDRQYVKNSTARVTARKPFTLYCTLAQNGALAQASNLTMYILDDNGKLCYYDQRDDIVRLRTAFSASLPAEGTYTMYIGSGSITEQITLECISESASQVNITSVSTDPLSESGVLSLVVYDEALYGKSAVMEIKNKSAGELTWWSSCTLEAYISEEFTMPHWSPSGEYELSITWDSGTASRSFTHTKQDEAVRITSLPMIEGSLATVESLASSSAAELTLRTLTDETVLAKVFLAFYDDNSNLLRCFASDATEVSPDATSVSVQISDLPQCELHAKLYVWANDTLAPLTDVYILQQKEGDR